MRESHEEPPSITQTQEISNHHHLVVEIAWFGLALPATARFLPIFAIRLGATSVELGWIAALPAIILLFASMFSSWWRKKYDNTGQAVFWPALIFRIVFLLPALAPFFPFGWGPVWLIVAASLPAVAQGSATVLFLMMMRESVTPARLSTLISRRVLALNIVVGASTLVMGLWLETTPFPFNYQSMFVLAYVFALVSFWHVTRVRVNAWTVKPIEPPPQPRIRRWRSPQLRLSQSRLPQLRSVGIVAMLVFVAYTAMMPIIPLRLVNEMGAGEGYMAVYALMELASGAIIAVFADRIIRRLGSRMVITLGMIGLGFAVTWLAFAPSLSLAFFAGLIGGASWTATDVARLGLFYEHTESEDTTRYTTIYFQMVSLARFVGPLIGSGLASAGISLPMVLLTGAGMFGMAGIAAQVGVAHPQRRLPRMRRKASSH